jgi:hypothetical protein
VIQAIYYALRVAPFIPPDEIWHYTFIQEISDNLLFPFQNNRDLLVKYSLDFTSKLDFTYHYILGLITIFTKPFVEENIYILRMVNIGLVTTGLYFVRKTAFILLKSAAYSNLVVLFSGQLLMFGVMAGAVNYDGMAFMVVAIISYVFTLFRKAPSMKYFLLLGTLCMSLFIIKISAVVIALGFGVWALVSYFNSIFIKKETTLKNEFRELLADSRGILVIAFFVLIVSLVSVRYLGMVSAYGTYKPSCVLIYDTETCEQYDWFYIRDKLNRQNAKPYDGNERLFVERWLEAMAVGFYGLVGDERIVHHPSSGNYGIAFMVFGLIAFIRSVSIKRLKILMPYILASSLYLVALVYTNFTTYKAMGGLAGVQGRYLFFILPTIIISAIFFMQSTFKRKHQAIPILILLILYAGFLSTSLFWFNYTTSNNRSIIIDKKPWSFLYTID